MSFDNKDAMKSLGQMRESVSQFNNQFNRTFEQQSQTISSFTGQVDSLKESLKQLGNPSQAFGSNLQGASGGFSIPQSTPLRPSQSTQLNIPKPSAAIRSDVQFNATPTISNGNGNGSYTPPTAPTTSRRGGGGGGYNPPPLPPPLSSGSSSGGGWGGWGSSVGAGVVGAGVMSMASSTPFSAALPRTVVRRAVSDAFDLRQQANDRHAEGDTLHASDYLHTAGKLVGGFAGGALGLSRGGKVGAIAGYYAGRKLGDSAASGVISMFGLDKQKPLEPLSAGRHFDPYKVNRFGFTEMEQRGLDEARRAPTRGMREYDIRQIQIEKRKRENMEQIYDMAAKRGLDMDNPEGVSFTRRTGMLGLGKKQDLYISAGEIEQVRRFKAANNPAQPTPSPTNAPHADKGGTFASGSAVVGERGMPETVTALRGGGFRVTPMSQSQQTAVLGKVADNPTLGGGLPGTMTKLSQSVGKLSMSTESNNKQMSDSIKKTDQLTGRIKELIDKLNTLIKPTTSFNSGMVSGLAGAASGLGGGLAAAGIGGAAGLAFRGMSQGAGGQQAEGEGGVLGSVWNGLKTAGGYAYNAAKSVGGFAFKVGSRYLLKKGLQYAFKRAITSPIGLALGAGALALGGYALANRGGGGQDQPESEEERIAQSLSGPRQTSMPDMRGTSMGQIGTGPMPGGMQQGGGTYAGGGQSLTQRVMDAASGAVTAAGNAGSAAVSGAASAIGGAIAGVKRRLSGGGGGSSKLDADQQKMMQGVYSAYRKAGLSDNQARALTAEVGRENDFRSKNIFGTHTDKGNRKTNLGFLSWQGDRKEKLERFLTERGLMKDGNMMHGQASLDAMAQFSVGELRGSHAKRMKAFMDNPNIDPEEAAKMMGGKSGYVGWAYGQDVLSTGERFDWRAHDARRRRHLGSVNQMVDGTSGAPSPSSAEFTEPHSGGRGASGGGRGGGGGRGDYIDLPNKPVNANTLVDYKGKKFNPLILDYVKQVESLGGLRLSGGHRTEERNRQVHGAKHSRHMSGFAVDFVGTREQMEAGLKLGRELGATSGSQIHDAGSGTHLHLQWARMKKKEMEKFQQRLAAMQSQNPETVGAAPPAFLDEDPQKKAKSNTDFFKEAADKVAANSTKVPSKGTDFFEEQRKKQEQNSTMVPTAKQAEALKASKANTAPVPPKKKASAKASTPQQAAQSAVSTPDPQYPPYVLNPGASQGPDLTIPGFNNAPQTPIPYRPPGGEAQYQPPAAPAQAVPQMPAQPMPVSPLGGIVGGVGSILGGVGGLVQNTLGGIGGGIQAGYASGQNPLVGAMGGVIGGTLGGIRGAVNGTMGLVGSAVNGVGGILGGVGGILGGLGGVAQSTFGGAANGMQAGYASGQNPLVGAMGGVLGGALGGIGGLFSGAKNFIGGLFGGGQQAAPPTLQAPAGAVPVVPETMAGMTSATGATEAVPASNNGQPFSAIGNVIRGFGEGVVQGAGNMVSGAVQNMAAGVRIGMPPIPMLGMPPIPMPGMPSVGFNMSAGGGMLPSVGVNMAAGGNMLNAMAGGINVNALKPPMPSFDISTPGINPAMIAKPATDMVGQAINTADAAGRALTNEVAKTATAGMSSATGESPAELKEMASLMKTMVNNQKENNPVVQAIEGMHTKLSSTMSGLREDIGGPDVRRVFLNHRTSSGI